jgi:PAS domain S-box-containing protein
VGTGIGLLVGLYGLRLHSYLLFHAFVEMFTVGVAVALFLLAWNSRRFTDDNAFVFLGCANLCLGIVTLLHTLAYKGMGVFTDWPGANLATQLWIVARTLESLSFLAFSLLIGRRLRPFVSLWLCLVTTALLLCAIFFWDIFPTCYEEGVGLTPFKIVSEYVICSLFAASTALLFRRRRLLDSSVYRPLLGAFTLAVLAELAFTTYVGVYGLSNLIGHYLHLLSFFLVYQALIRASLTRPYGTLFRELSAAREDVARRERYYRSILDHLHENIRIIASDGTVVEANRTYLESSGLSPEEVVGLPCDECVGVCEGMDRCGLGAVLATGKPASQVHEHRRADGGTVHEDVLFSPLRDESGKVFQVIAAARDITDLVEARKALESKLMELDTIMESTEDGILAMDDRGHVLHANRRLFEIWGLPDDSVPLNKGAPSANHARGLAGCPEGLSSRMRGAQSCEEDGLTTLRLEDGQTIEWHTHPFSGDGSHDSRGGVVWSFRDVTARKQMEAQLADSERRLRTLVEEAPISIMTFDAHGAIDFVNQYHLKAFGRNQLGKDFFLGRRITELPGLVRSGRSMELEPVLKGQPVDLDEVFIPEASQGFTGYQRIKAVPLFKDSEVMGGILLREDITESRRMAAAMEEQAAHYRAIINTTKDGFWVADAEGRILEMNDVACGMTGYSREELLDMKIQDLEASRQPEEFSRCVQQTIESGSGRFETLHRRKDGGFFDVEVTVTFIPSAHHLVSFVHDISARKQAELVLQQSLEEKVALLKEVHHRVKNNLQIVVSLLNLQSSRSRSHDVVGILADTRNRVYSMALLHEALYRSQNLARIDLTRYVEELCSQLMRSYGPEASRVGIEERIDSVSLPMEQAVPCGLIINELVSNALKHGFPGGRTGRITVELHSLEERRLHLRVSDDGVGLSGEGFPGGSDTLGLQLVSRLASQLGGELELSPGENSGVAFRVVFRAPEEPLGEGE